MEAFVKAGRDREFRLFKHMAALKGINLEEPAANRFDEIRARADAQLAGKSPQEAEYEELGIIIETDE